MQIEHNKSLKDYNSFGIDVKAKSFVSIQSEEELIAVLRMSYAEELFILGGGSNMLLTSDINATVLHIDIKGINVISESEDDALVNVQAGENWHDFVLWTLDKNFGGIENLSLIPGNVGTAPIQNIGAYGVELKDTFVKCEAIHIQTMEKKVFEAADCNFGYRDSIFKTQEKGNYIITNVTFQLTKKDHKLNMSYGAIENILAAKGIDEPTIQDISKAVISIRSSKLPNPKELGNSGSFFKNPVISKEDFNQLKNEFEHLPSYVVNDTQVKVPAGWLIDQCGLKGYRSGDAGIHKNQALVLVNYGDATGQEILNLSAYVQEKVAKKFGIKLEPEVNILP